MSTRIKVAVRVRPFLQSEIRNGYSNTLLNADKDRNEVCLNLDSASKSFKFDHVFLEDDSQQTVYNSCGIDHLVDKAVEGYHSTIFTYGQTGSGKTYTMQGNTQTAQVNPNEFSGIVPFTLQSLFKKMKSKAHEKTYSVYVSFLQIYNEKIYDLLNPSSLNPRNMGSMVGGLRLRWSKDEQFQVQNLFVFQCKSYEDLMQYFCYGLSNRINSSHKLNMTSSRSHTILSIRIESVDHRNPRHILSSKIELVDLAGSERIGLTGTEGKLAKESIDINKSLFTLRQVISILSDSRGKGGKEPAHVPYRQSKLTSILKQSIGGNSYCLMVACVSPNDAFLEDNLSTLAYATKASYIHNKPIINDDPSNKVIGDLKGQIKALKAELDQANKHIQLISNVNKGPVEDDRPMTDRSQRLSESPERSSQQPLFKRRLTDKIGASQDQFSQRLIESINMVRELLQSNKELREQLEMSQRGSEEKDFAIIELQKQNETLRDKVAELTCQQPPQSPPTPPPEMKPKKSQVFVNNLMSSQTPIVYGNNLGSVGKFVDNTFNEFNSFEINQFYISDRGGVPAPDCMPTNFNRRQIFSSQEERRRRNNSTGEVPQSAKKPMTAGEGRRKRTRVDSKGFSMIYNFKESSFI